MNTAARIILLALAVVTLSGSAAHADLVDFESQSPGTVFGSPVGNTPGDIVFSEDGADVVITTFQSGGSAYYNFARIEPSFGSPRFFYHGNIANLSNVGIIVHFSGAGDASFEFLDLGGSVNLRVNGSGVVMEAPDIADLAGLASKWLQKLDWVE